MSASFVELNIVALYLVGVQYIQYVTWIEFVSLIYSPFYKMLTN